MKCNFFSLTNNLYSQNNARNNQVSSPSFGANTPEKLIKKIITAQNPKSIKLSFDEIVKIYSHLGYDVTMKRGSHAIVAVGKINIPIVIPHKDKIVHPNDIKRLKLVMEGKAEKAKLV